MQPDQRRPPAVVYGAKSSEDTHGSIKTQLEDCRALAEHEGFEVIAEFSDEAASAYKGDRGPDLAAALAECERLGAALIVQHSDRLARGDGKRARHLVEYALWALKADVTIRSCQDDQTFGDLLYAVVTGQRNHEDSARKSKAVRAGLRRRAEDGQPVGAIPIGYRAEPVLDTDGRPKLRRDGKAETERVIDDESAALVEQIFSLAEKDTTPGDISRQLNREGATTIRRMAWTTRAVRRVLHNRDYTGVSGYPELIDPERFDRVQKRLIRMDPVAIRSRQGGRPHGEDFLLGGGLAFCLDCGAPMRCRRACNGRRTYRCANALEGGLCPESRPVDAVDVESLVVGSLEHYVEDLDGWLIEQLSDRRAEQAQREASLEWLRTQADQLEQQRERLLADYRRQVEAGRSTAYLALEQVERLDAERERLSEAISDAQAVVSEWADHPDLDAARALYEDLLALAYGEIENAEGAAQLGAALRRLLTAVRMGVKPDGLSRVEASLRVVETPSRALGHGEVPTSLPLPPLEIDIGRYVRTFVAEPLTSPVPPPLDRGLTGDHTRSDIHTRSVAGRPATTPTNA